MRNAADDDNIFVDPAVAKSEQQTGFHNAALANFIKASHNIDHAPEKTLALYFHQCAIAMSCRQLAQAGRIFAFGGRKGVDGHALISSGRARRVNSLMLTCGHYDGSGRLCIPRRFAREKCCRWWYSCHRSRHCINCRVVTGTQQGRQLPSGDDSHGRPCRSNRLINFRGTLSSC